MSASGVSYKIIAACEGNPGAARVIWELLGVGASLHESRAAAADDLVECVESTGLRGSLLWVAYKDVCEQDASRLWARMHVDREALAADARAAR